MGGPRAKKCNNTKEKFKFGGLMDPPLILEAESKPGTGTVVWIRVVQPD